MKIGSLRALEVLSGRRDPESSNKCGRFFAAFVAVAVATGAEQAVGIAHFARVEVVKARFDLVLETLELEKLIARLFELPSIGFPHSHHGARSRAELLPFADDALDVGQAKAEILHLTDPADANERIVAVEAKPP